MCREFELRLNQCYLSQNASVIFRFSTSTNGGATSVDSGSTYLSARDDSSVSTGNLRFATCAEKKHLHFVDFFVIQSLKRGCNLFI